MAGSLAVLSDAAHLAADLSAFVVAISGSHIASLPASDSHTFGLKRTESLAALFSMVSLAILSVGLACEAIRRMYIDLFAGGEVTQVEGKLMSSIAFLGVIVNVILAYVLGEDHIHMVGSDDCHGDHGHDHGHSHGHSSNNEHGHAHKHDEESDTLLSNKDHSYSAVNDVQHLDEVLPEGDNVTESKPHKKERNVNLHAAYLHVLADLLQSVVVLVAGLIIWWKPTWQLADPICTLIFSIIVCYSTIGVIRSSLSVLLEEVPPGVNWEEIYDAINGVDGVTNVHDLHIWSISHGNFILSVHAAADNSVQAYQDIKKLCNEKYNISHLTVQLQPASIDDCVTCTEESVHLCR